MLNFWTHFFGSASIAFGGTNGCTLQTLMTPLNRFIASMPCAKEQEITSQSLHLKKVHVLHQHLIHQTCQFANVLQLFECKKTRFPVVSMAQLPSYRGIAAMQQLTGQSSTRPLASTTNTSGQIAMAFVPRMISLFYIPQVFQHLSSTFGLRNGKCS